MTLIKWNPVDNDIHLYVDPPRPAEACFPNWYAKAPAKVYPDQPSVMISEEGEMFPNETIKRCVPFKDALSFGYIMHTWVDMWVSKNDWEDEDVVVTLGKAPRLCKPREGQSNLVPPPFGFNKIELAWEPKWYPETPEGYSCLLTHPLNRFDLPFQTMSAVIDTDKFTISLRDANFPFFIRKGFTGLIPVGTPMYQIIPFKREDWTSEAQSHDADFQERNVFKLKRHFLHGYRKESWSKKSYK